MNMVFNMLIALMIMFAMMIGAFHYYPTYQPQNSVGWIFLIGGGGLFITVMEAIIDGAGILSSWPKTQRLFIIAILCGFLFIAALPYISRMR